MDKFIYCTAFIVLMVFMQWGCKPKAINDFHVGFYNVENLFDTLDHPQKNDNEFLPNSKLAWDSKKYKTKLDRIANVFGMMNYPEVIGLAEVENIDVLNDLVNHKSLKEKAYKPIFFPSKDFRGIGNAILYQQNKVNPESISQIELSALDPNYTGRNGLLLECIVQGDPFTFVVVHFPSRAGGLEKTKVRRMNVAKQLRQYLDTEMQGSNENWVIMGDFNDEPSNESLQLLADSKTEPLYNLMSNFDTEEEGTYKYRGRWNLLDQFLVSQDLMNCQDRICFERVEIVKKSSLFFDHPKYGKMPNRTAGGPNYYGGYSDHLPILMHINFNAEKELKP